VNFGFGVLGNLFNFGISFNEIMMFATAITFLFALLSPIYTASQTKRDVNLLDYPGDTVYAFNYLWFDNFNFFNDKTPIACLGALKSNWSFVPDTGNSSNVTNGPCSTIPVYDFMRKINCELTAKALGLGTSTGSILNFISEIPIVGPFSFMVWGVIFTMAKIIFGCAIGGFRLVIGVSIAVYWVLKMLPVLEFMFKLIG
jgi:hypothetical protein